MKLVSLPANVNDLKTLVCYAHPALDLCIAMTKDHKIWKIDFHAGKWIEYEPDLLELALQGKIVEIEIINKLNSIPRSSSGRTTGFEPVNRGSNP